MSDSARPGEIIQSRREVLGLTRQDVADSLNLSVRTVEALETENWSQLPGPAFIRGYLRAYAKLLDLDGETVANAFESPYAGVALDYVGPMAAAERSHGVAELLQKHPGAVLSSAVGVVICAVVVVLMAVWPHGPQQAVAANAPADGAAVAASSSNASGRGDDSARAVHAALGADPSGARRITANGNDTLTFAFADDCWVDVRDARGGTLYSNLGKSGDILELIGRPPFHIRLDNAPAVTLHYNDERVALTPHTRNNVGTLVLGQ